MPLSLSTALMAAQCLGLAVVLVLLAAVWFRLRALPSTETLRLLRALEQRQRELEAFLARFERGEQGPKSEAEPVGSVRRFDPAASSAVAGPTLIAVPNLSAPPAGASVAASAELGRRFGTIWALADSGSPADVIARRTGQPIGQVELILGLRRQLAAHASGIPRAGGRA